MDGNPVADAPEHIHLLLVGSREEDYFLIQDLLRARLWQLVEDENAVRQPAGEFLRRCGYGVIEAKDGTHAVEVSGRHSGAIDWMVTDVVMPGMSGGQLAERMAKPRPEMKVLFISGYAEKTVRDHKILYLHTNFLQKPFTLQSLAR